jgi:hypothetical protein
MERSLVTDLRRDKYVERCKQRFFAYLDQGDLKKAAALFVRDMNVRPDCELPHHLAALGASQDPVRNPSHPAMNRMREAF